MVGSAAAIVVAGAAARLAQTGSAPSLAAAWLYGGLAVFTFIFASWLFYKLWKEK
jgi:hypothetical protein